MAQFIPVIRIVLMNSRGGRYDVETVLEGSDLNEALKEVANDWVFKPGDKILFIKDQMEID